MNRTRSPKLMILEGLRGFAAIYVLLHHIDPFHGTYFGWLTRFGQEAVTVFFLISGFVIHYSFAGAHVPSARSYFVRRFRRIYPPFVIALALTALLYMLTRGPDADLKPRDLVLNLLMLQDHEFLRPGSIVDPYLNNGVLWSLSYEWWFYVMYYPLATRVPESNWRRCVAAIALAGFVAFIWQPGFAARVALLFCVWWLGVEMARLYLAHGQVRLRSLLPGIGIALAAAIGLLGNALWINRTTPTSFGRYPWIEPRIVCVALTLTLIGVLWHRLQFRGGRSALRAFALIAPISYGLYVLHLPALALRELGGFFASTAGTTLLVALSVLLAYLVEIRLQSVVNRVLR